MKETDAKDVLAFERSMIAPLSELSDLSSQIELALDGGDQTVVRMLVAMRNDPIFKLAEADDQIRTKLSELSPEDEQQMRLLLRGEGGETELERQLAQIAGANRRKMQSLRTQDERISRRMTGEQSYYNKK